MRLPLLRLFFLPALLLISASPFSWAAIDQDYPAVKLQTLDKATARTNTVVVDVGQTVEFGSLFIKVQACRESGPLDQPESAAFLQIWEVPINADKSEWIFSGWMFASSPALSAMDHPVYDVWVLDCAGGEEKPAATNNVTVKIDGVEVDADAPLIQAESTDEEVTAPDNQAEEPSNTEDNSLMESIDNVLENLQEPTENPALPTEDQIIE